MPQGGLPPLNHDVVIVSDTETTGLYPFGAPAGEAVDPEGSDRLCALSAIVLKRAAGQWQIQSRHVWHVDPERSIPEAAARINNFERVAQQNAAPRQPSDNPRTNLFGLQKFADIIDEFLSIIKTRPLVFHSARFDTAVLDAELERAGRDHLLNPVVCTKVAFSQALGLEPGQGDRRVTSLNNLAATLQVDTSGRIRPDGREQHDAMTDALITAGCFSELDRLGWIEVSPIQSMSHRTSA